MQDAKLIANLKVSTFSLSLSERGVDYNKHFVCLVFVFYDGIKLEGGGMEKHLQCSPSHVYSEVISIKLCACVCGLILR